MCGVGLTKRITVSGIVKTCLGTVHSISVEPTADAGTIIIYDSPSAATGTVVCSFVTPASPGTPYEIVFNGPAPKSRTGLYCVVTNCSVVIAYS